MRRFLLIALVAFACGARPAPTTTTVTSAAPSTAPSAPAASVFSPATIGAYPVVVLFHGGGWFGGSPISTAGLAEFLADHGVVVFNATYRTGNGGGYPASFDDVACAVRAARVDAEALTTTPDDLTIMGHSAGAHLGSVVALANDVFGRDCGGAVAVTRFVGLSGVYDPTLYSQLLATFFHTRYETDPTPWEAGSPYTYIESATHLQVLLLHGADDQLVPVGSSELFAAALTEAGHTVTLEVLPGGDHQSTRQPEPAGPLILDWLLEPET